MLQCQGYSLSSIGKRDQNQDSFYCDNQKKIYAVADGVGGGKAGDIASQMAIQELSQWVEGAALKNLIQNAQNKILNYALTQFGEPIMGTTLTATLWDQNTLSLCHVGDSRCYLYSNQVLHQMTQDHESYDESHGAPVLSSYLGIQTQTYPLTIQEEIITVHANDMILLCSDGLYKQVPEMQIREKLSQLTPDNVESILSDLVSEAEKAEYSDNITLVLMRIFE